jgi:hypothetical protein
MTNTDDYKVHLKPVPSPAHEADPRLVPFEQNFYYPQEDFLAEMQKGQQWTWNVIRPEAIIGMCNRMGVVDHTITNADIYKATHPSPTV